MGVVVGGGRLCGSESSTLPGRRPKWDVSHGSAMMPPRFTHGARSPAHRRTTYAIGGPLLDPGALSAAVLPTAVPPARAAEPVTRTAYLITLRGMAPVHSGSPVAA